MVACTPHPGFGTVRLERPALVQLVDLDTCKVRAEQPSKSSSVRVVVQRHGTSGSQTIVFHGKPVLAIRESYARIPGGTPGPIELFGISPDRRWVLYAIDPMSSASLAADGLQLRAAPVAGGPSKTVAFGLLADDYRAWCGGRLVMTAGGDRIATHDKWLVVTGPPDWRAHVLVKDPHSAFGSLACGVDGRSVVVESSPAGGLNMNVHAHWSIWRIGFDGTRTRLTKPPPGASDESPQVLGSTVYFVRARSLYALRAGKLVGPLLQLPAQDAYYGHREWPYTVTR